MARQAAYLTEALLGSNAYLPDPYNPYGTVGQSSVNEVTNSLYLQSAWEFDVANFPVQLNVGARYEKTDVTSSVRQDVEKQVNWVSPSEWIMAFLVIRRRDVVVCRQYLHTV
ncbi:TonB-dependent receptor [Alishewanella longhuensis]